ncbi:MAG: CBS domain-containing protein [Nitrospira sp.]|nr:CBS domain-containing protein [Nitrospira sp.]MBH0180687.1 CBS domain-containing protein [Nitrospira sp.]MBH0187254.1 CBS domain-containing protein [Nitrospira sp.]MBH0189064.1 CBS domain-containing protein [Nitrospira sp.]MBH0197761.1 CBS domain-containing protein [Nitrospira sp.]
MPTKKKVRVVKKQDCVSMTVKDVMETQVQSVHIRTKGDVIASLMIEGFGAVPVINKTRTLIGIVSEHDLLGAIDNGQKLGALTAEEVMTGNPYSVRPETDLGTLVHVLRASDLVRVPVVDAKDRLVGIIARRDVLRTYLSVGSPNRK